MLNAFIKEIQAGFKIIRNKSYPRIENKPSTDMVVLIHGFTGAKSNLFPLTEFLLKNGKFNDIEFFEYPIFQSLNDTVKKLNRFIDKHQKYMEVKLIGHSLGGLLARMVSKDRNDVTALVTIGAPYIFGPEITYDECAIFGENDYVVPPPKMKDRKDKYYVYSDVGHIELLLDPRVHQCVLSELT